MTRRRALHAAALSAPLIGLLTTPATAAPPKWESTPLPPLSGLAVPNEVAAAGPNAVWVAGHENATSETRPYVLAWNGRKWSRQALPVSKVQIRDLAAAGPRNAWALAETVNNDGETPVHQVALHWNGSRWRKVGYPAGVKLTMPGPLPSQLEALSASPGGPAWSLGYDAKAKQAVALRFQQGRWVRQKLPVAMTSASTVTVRSAKDIWIAGTFQLPGTGPTQALLHWNGKRWKTVRYPAVDRSYIAKIAPTGGGKIWAHRTSLNYGTSPELLRWNGSQWRATKIPSSSPLLYSYPNLADDGAGGAWVTPNVSDTDARYLHYSGGRWTKEQGNAPSPAAPAWIYDLVRVPGTRTIWAAGVTDPLSGHAFVERRR